MDTTSQRDELIDVVVRLPRKAIEDALLSMPASAGDLPRGRLGAAKAMLAGWRRRAACFTRVRFGDPSWAMILELYVATGEHRSLAVSQLCDLSGGSTTTALRHIENLEGLGLISRDVDQDDRRRMIVVALPSLIIALERWLDLQMAASQIDA